MNIVHVRHIQTHHICITTSTTAHGICNFFSCREQSKKSVSFFLISRSTGKVQPATGLRFRQPLWTIIVFENLVRNDQMQCGFSLYYQYIKGCCCSLRDFCLTVNGLQKPRRIECRWMFVCKRRNAVNSLPKQSVRCERRQHKCVK